MEKETVLVTGGTGFVGIHVILQLLQQSYRVRTTLRNPDRKPEVIEMLKNGHLDNFENLTFIKADLTKDDNWDEAVKGCDYVLHVASPFPSGEPKDENEVILPAVDGTLRVLKAARNANVKRVVMTSSFAAIGYSIDPKNHVFTEKDWTDANVKLPAYIKSKTLAERAAWDFIKSEGRKMEFTVINPVGIFGPVLGSDFSSSIALVEQLLTQKMKAVPKLHFGLIDVRDVATLHLKAMKSPDANGERFLACADENTSLPDIARILRSLDNAFAKKVTRKVLPDWLVKVSAFFKPELKSVASQLGKEKKLSNAKAKRLLDWHPITKQKTIRETAESLTKFIVIK